MKDNKKHRVLNGELILAELFLIPMSLLFLGGTATTFSSGVKADTESKIFFCLVTTVLFLLAVISFLFMRHYHEFDAKGIRVWYFGGKYQYIKWSNVRNIMVWSDPTNTRGGALLDFVKMIFFVYRKYLVVGKCESTLKRDAEFIISKSFRTTKYINMYWNGEIEGTFSKKATKKKKSKKLNADKVIKMEKEVALKADLIIDDYRESFAALGVELRRSYVYSYDDESGDSASRPADAYTYDVEVTLHEKHKDHSVNISVPVTLMEGRPGKTEFLGFRECFEEELREGLGYYYNEIEKLGFSACRENEENVGELVNSEIKKKVLIFLCIGIAVIAAVIAFAIFLV